MPMPLLVVSLVALLSAGTPVTSQDIPDFSGVWKAAIAKPTGREVLALGETFTVTQLDTILQLEVPGSKRTLIIDGMAHEVRMPGEAPARAAARGTPPVVAAPPTRVVTTRRSMTTTSVQDGALKIVTVDTETTTQPTTPPTSTDTRRTTTLLWRLQPDGTLLVERTIVGDAASGRAGGASTVKTTYAKSGG